MQIKSEFTNPDGTISFVTYEDSDSFEMLDKTKVKQVYAVCLQDKKMVIVLNGKRNTWGLVGGTIEENESYENCLAREVKEETNMRVITSKPVGYQAVYVGENLIYQLRYVCKVEPYGDFICDPDGSVTEVKMIDPRDYKKYFNWGDIGERIVERALEFSKEL